MSWQKYFSSQIAIGGCPPPSFPAALGAVVRACACLVRGPALPPSLLERTPTPPSRTPPWARSPPAATPPWRRRACCGCSAGTLGYLLDGHVSVPMDESVVGFVRVRACVCLVCAWLCAHVMSYMVFVCVCVCALCACVRACIMCGVCVPAHVDVYACP